MKESAFNSWLRARLPGMSVRIENAIAAGLPDIALFWEGRTYWIENKVGKHALLRPYQLATMNSVMWCRGRIRTLVFLLDEPMIRVWQFPVVTEFTGSHHRIVSEPIYHCHRSLLHEEEICGILKKSCVIE